MHTEQNNSKVAGSEWHERRQEARETAFSPEEFSRGERTRFNLNDDDHLSPAGITGEDNPETYEGDDPGPGESVPPEQRDIRDDPYR